MLAIRQARRNLIEDANGDVDMDKANEEAAVETRPTKTVTNKVVVNVRAQPMSPRDIHLLLTTCVAELRSRPALRKSTLTGSQTVEPSETVWAT